MVNDVLRVGIVQTSLDYKAAWRTNVKWDDAVRMSSYEEKRAKKEIRQYLASLQALEKKQPAPEDLKNCWNTRQPPSACEPVRLCTATAPLQEEKKETQAGSHPHHPTRLTSRHPR